MKKILFCKFFAVFLATITFGQTPTTGSTARYNGLVNGEYMMVTIGLPLMPLTLYSYHIATTVYHLKNFTK